MAPLNIPIVTGPRQFLTPIRALRQWLNTQYPGSKLPFNLNKISDDDLEGLADYILFRLPDGRQVPLRHIFGPQLFSPDWSSKEPGRYQNLMDFLRSPKNILLTVSGSFDAQFVRLLSNHRGCVTLYACNLTESRVLLFPEKLPSGGDPARRDSGSSRTASGTR